MSFVPSTPVVGDIASAATDSGNPVKVAGKYNSTPTTFTDGQRGDIQLTSNGSVMVTPFHPVSGYGYTPIVIDGLQASSVVTVSTVGVPRVLGGYHFYNPSNAAAYVQFFNTNGTVTLGGSAPRMVIGMATLQHVTLAIGACPIDFPLGIKLAATTTASGSTNPATAITGTLFYK